MTVRAMSTLALVVWLTCGGAMQATAAEGQGRIEGQVVARDGTRQAGVSIIVRETGEETLTDRAGRYAFARVPEGTYTLVFIHGADQVTRMDVTVRNGETTVVDIESEWKYTFAESLTVYSASRREERVVEAPSAVTVVSEDEIEREASHGQLPKLLEFTPGAEVTQSGLYDYNFNTRGFNSSLNRRVATLIDGRNPALPFLGAQEWAGISFPLDELASAELVRGPSAALYGANASSGVLNLTTKQPRFSQGGRLRLTSGNLDTTNVDFRYADGLGGDWYVKVTGGIRNSGDFSVSRVGAAEYSIPCSALGQTDCLPQEAVPLDPFDDDEISFGSLRFDKYMDGGGVLTVEGGTASIKGPVFQTGIGRVQVVDAERPWARVNYSMDHWNFLGSYTARDAPEQTALASGSGVVLDTYRAAAEVQTHWSFADNRARVVVGGSFHHEKIDTFDPAVVGTPPSFNGQTLILDPLDEDFRALFGQVDLRVAKDVKVVLAGRWDSSSLHDSELSPKASVVWTLAPDHSLRATYNEAFQVANYSEFFLRAFGDAPANLSQVENTICFLSGVSCGLGNPTPVLALGNDDLKLEQIKTFEVGYSGILRGKALLTVDYYRSDNKDFITDLLPVGSTPLGRINSGVSPWIGPAAAESGLANPLLGFPAGTTVADAVRLTVPDLSTDFVFAGVAGDGDAIVLSYTNIGDVDTEGIDLGLSAFLGRDAHVSVNASWFDFDIKGTSAALVPQLVPNTPERKVSLSFGRDTAKLDWNVSYRWAEDFRWVVGPFQGDVRAYSTIDVNYNYRFNDNWAVGVNVANALDNVHYEAFGGDLLGRRALGHLVFEWE